MSVIRVELAKETYGQRDGSYTGQRVYTVEVNDLADDAAAALTADDGTNSIPSAGDAWSAGASARVTGKSATNLDTNQLLYQVTVDYSAKGTDIPTADDPTARPAQYSYGSESVSEPYFRDTDGNPVANSAGDVFQDLPVRDASRGTITITRNVETYDDLTAESYRDTINSGNVTLNGTTYAARTLRIRAPQVTGPHEENGYTFYTESWTLLKNKDGWDTTLEDRGVNELDDGKLKPILDTDGNPIVLPYPLDGSGAAKAAPDDAPAIGTFKPYLAGLFPTF